jgi:DNA-binding transcriptional LysR family regulator
VDILWFNDLANLARTGNFSQAAVLGNVSQPALSRRIKALEDWVGTALVDRSCHPVRLTPPGQQILEAGIQALSRLESERGNIREALAQPDRYVVTFAAQHSIGWRFYPSWLQAFENAYGSIISRLRADNLPNCFDDLENGVADFVISYRSRHSRGVADLDSLQSIIIGKDLLIPVCKCGTDGAPIFSLDDARAGTIPYLRFGSGAPIGLHIEPLIGERGIAPRLNVIYENWMVGALRIRTQDGAGIAWLPRSVVQPDLDAGLLAIAGNPGWFIDLDIRLHRLGGRTNALTRKIWAFLAVREDVPLLSG